MNPELRNLLLPFHFGAVTEEQRLEVEQELLTDTETLVDYLDLKRQAESARAVPSRPSSGLWEKIKPTHFPRRRTWVSVTVGAALAAGLFFYFQHPTKPVEFSQPSVNRALFDSNAELPASSGVL
jgi:hypothetical protein